VKTNFCVGVAGYIISLRNDGSGPTFNICCNHWG